MKIAKYLARVASVVCTMLAVGEPSHAATISLACDSVGDATKVCKEGAEIWAKRTGNMVKLVPVPTSSADRLALYQQILSAESSVIDVFMIDAVWSGMLSSYFVDLREPAKGVIKDHFPAIVKNNTVNGHLIAMPWFADAGLLYYRKDLLRKYGEKVPPTWESLILIARKIQDSERKTHEDTKMWGYVWQGKSYEGLTCNALEWIGSYDGGTIVDASGKITINNPEAVQALRMARTWIGSISPKDVLNYSEEEARKTFQSGNAVFMRNWPYAWSAVNNPDSPIKDKVGIAALPKGNPHGHGAATLGGQQLAVSIFSKNTDIAVDLVMYLSSKEEQKRRAITASYNPTIRSLYQDKEMLAANPSQRALYDSLPNVTVRPSTVMGGKYNQISSEFWDTVHDVLSTNNDPAASIRSLEGKLRRHLINLEGK